MTKHKSSVPKTSWLQPHERSLGNYNYFTVYSNIQNKKQNTALCTEGTEYTHTCTVKYTIQNYILDLEYATLTFSTGLLILLGKQ